MFNKVLNLSVVLCFFLNSLNFLPQAHADTPLHLPQPGAMVDLSPAFVPAMIKGITVHKDNPFLFDFIIDGGNEQSLRAGEGERLVKYFFGCLTVPEKDLWVNLSPYEKDRIVPQALGTTALGRDLLAEDYILKQLTASLIYPQRDLGKAFWERVYAQAKAQYGTTQVPVNTFNKVWIVADHASVYEEGQTAFVVDGHLKVMLDEDYLAMQKHEVAASPQSVASNIIRQIVLPEIEKEVNTDRNFAALRQIFNALILASWYKKDLKQALLNQVYADKNTVKGVNLADPSVKERIYQQYIKAYKKGVFNFVKEDAGPGGQTIPRKYFSGGFMVNPSMLSVIHGGLKNSAMASSLVNHMGKATLLTVFLSCNSVPGKGQSSRLRAPAAGNQAMTTSYAYTQAQFNAAKVNPLTLVREILKVTGQESQEQELVGDDPVGFLNRFIETDIVHWLGETPMSPEMAGAESIPQRSRLVLEHFFTDSPKFTPAYFYDKTQKLFAVFDAADVRETLLALQESVEKKYPKGIETAPKRMKADLLLKKSVAILDDPSLLPDQANDLPIVYAVGRLLATDRELPLAGTTVSFRPSGGTITAENPFRILIDGSGLSNYQWDLVVKNKLIKRLIDMARRVRENPARFSLPPQVVRPPQAAADKPVVTYAVKNNGGNSAMLVQAVREAWKSFQRNPSEAGRQKVIRAIESIPDVGRSISASILLSSLRPAARTLGQVLLLDPDFIAQKTNNIIPEINEAGASTINGKDRHWGTARDTDQSGARANQAMSSTVNELFGQAFDIAKRRQELEPQLLHVRRNLLEQKATLSETKRWLQEFLEVHQFAADSGMNSVLPAAENGGIDLNTAAMGFKVFKDARGGVQVSVDRDLMERIMKEGLHSAVPVIIRESTITQAQILPLLQGNP